MKSKLDLHRLNHDDAYRATINFIEMYWLKGAELEIITGNSQKMRDLVTDILEEYKLSYTIGRKFDEFNMGYIVTWT